MTKPVIIPAAIDAATQAFFDGIVTMSNGEIAILSERYPYNNNREKMLELASKHITFWAEKPQPPKET